MAGDRTALYTLDMYMDPSGKIIIITNCDDYKVVKGFLIKRITAMNERLELIHMNKKKEYLKIPFIEDGQTVYMYVRKMSLKNAEDAP
jgi:hypothetical protein